MNLDTMPAGRELDALVAERVMGYIWWHNKHGRNDLMSKDSLKWGETVGLVRGRLDGGTFEDTSGVPAYSTDMGAAWPLLDRFGFIVGPHFQPGWTSDPSGMPRDGWFVFRSWESSVRSTFDEDSDGWALAIAETLPLALCRAALKAAALPMFDEDRHAAA